MAGSRKNNRYVCFAYLVVVTCLLVFLMNSYFSNFYFMLQPKASAELTVDLFTSPPRAAEDMEVDVSEQLQHWQLPRPLGSRPPTSEPCGMDRCFDFHHCSLDSGFPVYFYTDEELAPLSTTFQLSPVKFDLSRRMYGTRDPARACVFVVAVGEMVVNRNSLSGLENVLQSLPFWKHEGRNHLVISFTKNDTQGFLRRWTGQGLVAGPAFWAGFREDFDIVIPPRPEAVQGALWTQLRPLFPIHRTLLLSFWGHYIPAPGEQNEQLHELKTTVMSDLQILQKAEGVDLLTSCGESTSSGWPTDWALCGTTAERSSQLSHSTFALLLSPLYQSLTSTILFQIRLQETLRNGAVPVIVGPSQNRLPFQEMINWRDISVCLPFPRLHDLIHILSSFSDNDIFEFRRLGRFVFETYFSSSEQILLSALTVVRSRLGIPAAPVAEEPTSVILSYPDGSADKSEGGSAKSTLRVPSHRFQRNFTFSLEQRMWNYPGYPFFLFPSTPFEPELPAECRVLGEKRLPNEAFDDNLGGSLPREQFTVVINSYKRPYALLSAIARLKNLPYLNKVLIIWADPDPPSPQLVWPKIHVPVVVTRVNGTSLNVRYQPFDVIDTDCVLSLDDDIQISHTHILHAFRVWRGERDNIVGFKTRSHVWNRWRRRWQYFVRFQYPEYSIVLPTTAMFHKLYLYAYTYSMPQVIRDRVTEGRNCEDIAMTVLVAHITRKPPIRVFSDIHSFCPGCSTDLSHSTGHTAKRSGCLQFFNKVYGYMPLLFRPRRVYH